MQDEKARNVLGRFERLVQRLYTVRAPIHSAVGKLDGHRLQVLGEALGEHLVELLRKQVVGVLRLQLVNFQRVLESLHADQQLPERGALTFRRG